MATVTAAAKKALYIRGSLLEAITCYAAAERAFRFSERKDTDSRRLAKVMQIVAGKRLTYRTPTGAYDDYHRQRTGDIAV
jgi:hypothetical protein